MKKTFSKKNMPFKTKDQTNKIGLGLSISILALVVLGMIAVFCDTHTYGFMSDYETGAAKYAKRFAVFPDIGPHLLAYFHFAINILVAIIMAINIVEFALVQKRKLVKTHSWLHICNLVSATSLAFNFVFSISYLIPAALKTDYNWQYIFTGSNLIFNGITPILAVFIYVFCFKGYSLKNKWLTLIGIAPVFAYFLTYMILALITSNAGISDIDFDFYRFGAEHYYMVIIIFILYIVVSTCIAFGLVKLNSIAKLNRWMLMAVINIFIAVTAFVFSICAFHTNIVDDRHVEGFTVTQTILTRFLLFTHLSNWLLMAAAICSSIYAIKKYNGQIKTIPVWAQMLKLAAVACVFITLFAQILVASSKMIGATNWQEALTEAYLKAFRKHLLFEHFLIPVIAIVSFIVVEHSDLKWKHLLHTASPLAIYVLVYAIVLYCHLDEPLRKTFHAKYVTIWDMYDVSEIFGKSGRYIYWALPFVVYGLMLIVNWLFWMISRKIHFELPKKAPVWQELKKDKLAWKARHK